MKRLEITVKLSMKAAADLPEFVPVEGWWEVNEASNQHYIPQLAAECAAEFTDDLCADDFKVELFRSDGRSLDGSDGIISGNLLVSRKPRVLQAAWISEKSSENHSLHTRRRAR